MAKGLTKTSMGWSTVALGLRIRGVLMHIHSLYSVKVLRGNPEREPANTGEVGLAFLWLVDALTLFAEPNQLGEETNSTIRSPTGFFERLSLGQLESKRSPGSTNQAPPQGERQSSASSGERHGGLAQKKKLK